MLAVRGIYDGMSIIPLEKIESKTKSKLPNMFFEKLDQSEMVELRKFISPNGKNNFWDRIYIKFVIISMQISLGSDFKEEIFGIIEENKKKK